MNIIINGVERTVTWPPDPLTRAGGTVFHPFRTTGLARGFIS